MKVICVLASQKHPQSVQYSAALAVAGARYKQRQIIRQSCMEISVLQTMAESRFPLKYFACHLQSSHRQKLEKQFGLHISAPAESTVRILWPCV